MDQHITTGIPWLDQTIAVLFALGALSSLLSHYIGPDSFPGKLISWMALNFGKKLAKPAQGELVDLKPLKAPPDRGFARLAVLVVLALLSIAVAARAAPNPDAIKDAIASDPAAVQPIDPTPIASQYGGCVGKFCFAPSVTISLAAVNLSTKKIEGAFSPGVGYGVTYLPGRWYSVGADAYFVIDPGAQQASISVCGSFFNGYFRPGVSKGFIGDTAWRLLLGVGLGL